MAYRQKTTSIDIRTIPTAHIPPVVPVAQSPDTQEQSHYHPAQDIWAIITLFVPLLALLFVAYYFDVTRHWVIPLATRLFHLGS